MVCYQTTTGDEATRRATRKKHYVLFDQPVDKGAELKAAYPDLGWATTLGLRIPKGAA